MPALFPWRRRTREPPFPVTPSPNATLFLAMPARGPSSALAPGQPSHGRSIRAEALSELVHGHAHAVSQHRAEGAWQKSSVQASEAFRLPARSGGSDAVGEHLQVGVVRSMAQHAVLLESERAGGQDF